MSKSRILRFISQLHIAAFWILTSVLLYKMIDRKIHKNHDQNLLQHCKHLAVRHPVTEKKPIAVVVTSYNNETFCEKNLESIFDQTYNNYRVIYIDDASTDNTFKKVSDYIALRGMGEKVTLIRNKERKLKTANLYHGVHLCQDHEIAAIVDGDDWLSCNDALETINSYYQDPTVWVTYGSTTTHPKVKEFPCIPVPEKSLANRTTRFEPFRASMLRTFYAGLFKVIPLTELCFNGDFLQSADDVAYMTALFEMAPKHIRFCSKVLYVINDSNPIRSIFQEPSLQEVLHRSLSHRTPIDLLPPHFDPTCIKTKAMLQKIPLIVLSKNPQNLLKNLKSYQQHPSPLSRITVVYKDTHKNTASFENLATLFPDVEFIKNAPPITLFNQDTPYILIASDDRILDRLIDLKAHLEHLEKSKGEAFFLNLPISSLKTRSLMNNTSFALTAAIAAQPENYLDSFLVLVKSDLAIKGLQNWLDNTPFLEGLLSANGISFISQNPLQESF